MYPAPFHLLPNPVLFLLRPVSIYLLKIPPAMHFQPIPLAAPSMFTDLFDSSNTLAASSMHVVPAGSLRGMAASYTRELPTNPTLG